MIIGSLMMAMIPLSLDKRQDALVAIESAKAGLEECPNFNSNNSTDTIWVKDCQVHTELYFSRKQGE